MSKKFVFDYSTIHTLHRYSKLLFEVFSKADHQIIEAHNEWNHSNELDFMVNPHRYYSYRAGSIQMEIINKHTKVNNPCFCLLCSGFVPPDVEPYDDVIKVREENDTFYNNLYGKFLTFDKCLTEYYRVVAWLVEYKDNPLFDV